MALDGLAVFYATAGGVLLWSGIKGQTVGQTVKAVTSGDAQALSAAGAQVITGSLPPGIAATAGGHGGEASGAPGDTSAHSASAAANQATARLLAVSLGHPDWIAGQQWADWVSLWNQESSWMDEANPHSSARGIAQNINGYGPGYQQGNLPQQIAWGIGYIADRYGSPSKAWAHEQSFNWY